MPVNDIINDSRKVESPANATEHDHAAVKLSQEFLPTPEAVGSAKQGSHDKGSGTLGSSNAPSEPSSEGSSKGVDIKTNDWPSNTGPYPKGIDISNYENARGDIDWNTVSHSGPVFTGIKATEGHDWKDQYFDENWKNATAAGQIPLAYHFWRSDDDPNSQADFFCKVVGQPHKGDLPPQFDVEDENWGKITDPKQRVDRLLEWCYDEWKQRGQQPFLYLSNRYTNQILANDPRLGDFPLWQAYYHNDRRGTDWPDVPKPWDKATIWQFSDFGQVPGLKGDIDLDLFNGTQDQLNEFRYGMQTPEQQAVLDAKFQKLEGEVEQIRAQRTLDQFQHETQNTPSLGDEMKAEFHKLEGEVEQYRAERKLDQLQKKAKK